MWIRWMIGTMIGALLSVEATAMQCTETEAFQLSPAVWGEFDNYGRSVAVDENWDRDRIQGCK